MNAKRSRFAVMGSGGVGGYFGAALARAGEDVTFVARGEHLKRMADEGLSVKTPKEEFRLPVRATDDPSRVGEVDFVLFAVKLWDTEEAAAAIAAMVGGTSAVVSLQNGVLSEDVLSQRYGAERVFGGVAEISSTLEAPGRIRCHSPFARIVFGEMGTPSRDRTAALSGALRSAGIEHVHSETIEERIWRKFVFLVGLSATTASTGRPIGDIRERPEDRARLERIIDETCQVATARGVRFTGDVRSDSMLFIDGLPKDMRASMAHDLEAGRPLELDWLSGAVSQMGRELGIPTPENDAVVSRLRPYAKGGRT